MFLSLSDILVSLEKACSIPYIEIHCKHPTYMDKDFLLSNEISKKLYHEYSSTMPIIDYHCHINPREIAEDRKFENITQVWLGGDHYKWRFMRSCGVDEYYITGEAPDKEK